MKNRVENLFLTKIRTTFVLSNVGFPTLIDLTNLTREIPCREARVSSFMYGRESPGGEGTAPGRGFCSGAAGSVPVPRILCQRRRHRFSSWLQVALIYNRRRSLHGALPEGRRTGPFQTGRTNPLPGRGANPFRTGAPGPFAGGGWAYGPFSNRTHGPFAGMAHGAEDPERPGREAFAAGYKRKERFHAENPIFFSIFASIGKIVNLNAEAV